MIEKTLTPQERLQRLDKLSKSLDTKWNVMGVNVGWDTVIGLIPGIGDTVTSCISAYIVREAHLLGVPFLTKCRMVWNIVIDWIVGLVPVIGDLLDIGWKANRRNVKLIMAHAQKHGLHEDNTITVASRA